MSTIINVPTVNTRVYNAALLQWENAKQAILNTDTLTVSLAGIATAANQTTANTSLSTIAAKDFATQATLAAIDTSTTKLQLTPASGSVNGVGNNTLLTPSSGKKLRLSYASYNPALAVEAAFRFGAAGTLFLRNSLTVSGVVSKDFGDMRYLEGAVDEPLILNLSLGVATIWNALYTEI